MKARTFQLPELKEDSSLSKLRKFPIKIYVSDIQKALDRCYIVIKNKQSKSLFGKLSHNSKAVKKLQEYLDVLDPSLENESGKLLQATPYDKSAPLNDKQLLDLVKIILQFAYNEDADLHKCLAILEDRYHFGRLAAIGRLADHRNFRIDYLALDDIKLLCHFIPRHADFAARLIQCMTSGMYYFSKYSGSISDEISYSESCQEHAKAIEWAMALSLNPGFNSWAKDNSKKFIDFCIQCSLDNTKKISAALITLKQERDVTIENRDLLFELPKYAENIANGLIWLKKSGIYTAENIKKIEDYPDFIGYLKKVGHSELPVSDQDTGLNQIIFDTAMGRAMYQRQVIGTLFFPKDRSEKINYGEIFKIADIIDDYIAPVPRRLI